MIADRDATRATRLPRIHGRIVQVSTISAACAITIMAVVYYASLKLEAQSAATRSLEAIQQAQSTSLMHAFSGLGTDSAFLASLPSLHATLDQQAEGRGDPGAAPSAVRLQESFVSFLRGHPYLTQIRLIASDSDARELVRVNATRGEIEIVAGQDLQSKAGEPYMQAARNLHNSTWLLSGITLNREYGSVPSGSRPTIRAVYATTSDNGTPGFLILNADFEDLVRHAIGPLPQGHCLSVNTELGFAVALCESGSTTGEDGFLSTTRTLDLFGAGAGRAGPEQGPTLRLASSVLAASLIEPIDEQLTMLLGVAALALLATVLLANRLGHLASRPIITLARLIQTPDDRGASLQQTGRRFHETNMLVESFVDLTDSLRDSQSQYSAIVEAAGDCILTVDQRGKVLAMNTAGLKMFGLEPGQAPGLEIDALMPERFRARHAALMVRYSELPNRDEPFHLRATGLHSSGREFPIEATLTDFEMNGVRVFMAIMRDISERRAQEQLLEARQRDLVYGANHDALTDLLNRRGAREQLAKSGQAGQTATVFHIDLDRFKEINDHRGHEAGDTVLKNVSQRLNAICGAEDVVARIGGDEFLVVRFGLTQAECAEWAGQLLALLNEPISFQGAQHRVSGSIGVAHGTDGELASGSLGRSADYALYSAKRAGRAQVKLFDEPLKLEYRNRRSLIHDLQFAQANKQLELVYMPKVDLATMKVIGIEGLLRWRHPERGLLAPGAFLQYAEDLGTLGEIDTEALRIALADRAYWTAAGYTPPRISLNISTARLVDPALAHNLKQLDLPRGALGFELLESVFLDEPGPTILAAFAQLRAKGISLEVDDFGSGHASIIALAKIDPDEVKLDRGLVAGVDKDPQSRAVVQALIEMLVPFNARVVAEGIETQAQLETLRDIGCDAGQGFFFGKPMDRVEIVSRFAQGPLMQVRS